ncbi:hypothetical protein OG601_38470 [Streptomyces sp. NBC_01239]|uniref:hypothetical protein n=1 Tax=Streptomyces sp. NBC_01239 TaxID=2903792 RepID=UPI00225B6AE8|nr:hypothetical protein [Streptomyces sp. NBC_01239]MCX4816495.1 hypothetical protein [Streptomyces sp. NBC_01239]
MSLTSAQSATLLALAAAVIPAGASEPAADAVLADGHWLGRAFAAEPRLEALVAHACDRLRDQDPLPALRSLASRHPAEFDALTTAVTGAYYMAPEVRAAIGYPGQIRRPAALTEAADDLEDDLIAPLLASGPRYRPTPEAPAGPSA